MLHCKTFCRRGAGLVLAAALALTGCTAGLGSEPTVETDPAATQMCIRDSLVWIFIFLSSRIPNTAWYFCAF